MSKPLLVTGAAGHLGRRVIDLLLAESAGPVIAATRSPEKLADLRARGVEVRRADFDAPGSLTDAFAGVGRVLIISTDALDAPGRRLTQHRNAIEAAARVGVDHVVYTSVAKAGPTSVIAVTPDHWGTEQALSQSKLGFTILRNNLYTELLLGALPRAVATGQHVTACADGATAYVTREDCARAAAAALASSFSGRRTLEISGPSAVTQGELASIASELTGKPITHVSIPRPALEDGMQKAGLPAPLASIFASFDEGAARGELALVSPAFEELTGKPAESVQSFLTRNVAALLAAPAR